MPTEIFDYVYNDRFTGERWTIQRQSATMNLQVTVIYFMSLSTPVKTCILRSIYNEHRDLLPKVK